MLEAVVIMASEATAGVGIAHRPGVISAKHLDVRRSRIQDSVKQRRLSIQKILTGEDIDTKVFNASLIEELGGTFDLRFMKGLCGAAGALAGERATRAT